MYFKVLAGLLLVYQAGAAFECYGMSKTTSLWGQRYTCPGSAQQCYKYVCTGSPQNPFYILKGCLDTSTTTLTCSTMDNDCKGIGGTGTCYTCSNSRCNDASSLVMNKSFLVVFPIFYLVYKVYF